MNLVLSGCGGEHSRKSTLDEEKEAKRRELEKQSDPYQAYIPPPNPPIKAREVYVQVVADVSLPASPVKAITLTSRRSRT